MAKYDAQSSRQTAVIQDEAMEQFYRPAASPEPRARLRKQIGLRPHQTRPLPDPINNGEDEDHYEDQEETFLRARLRVPIRRGLIPQSKVGRIALAAGAIFSLAALAALGIAVNNFLRHDPRFRIDSSAAIQIMGNSQVTRTELLSVFGSDIGRNLFFVPLSERRTELEKLPWVAHASVMRLLPNQLRVSIVERTPVAFVHRGDTIGLVDAHGVLLDMPPRMMAAKRYSFPVVTGIGAEDPPSERAARMLFYQRFVADLDSRGERISQQLSEVDISDSEDIRALLPTPGGDLRASEVLVHFGDSDFHARYERYKEHLAEWRRQYSQLASVDLRYDNQVVLGMAKGAAVETGPDGNSAAARRPEIDATRSASPRLSSKPASPVENAQKSAQASARRVPPAPQQKQTKKQNRQRKKT